MKYKIAIFFLSLLVIGCGSAKKSKSSNKKPTKTVVSKPKPKPTVKETEEELSATSKVYVVPKTVQEYIDKFSAVAQNNMRDFKIPASITLAQGILESGSGKGRLCLEANNHFGIKCHKGWTGPSISHDDDAKGECFRKYDDPADSYRDHSLFLTSRSRYADLFQLDILDYKAWAKGLKKAGYATDPKYPSKLISIIERYNLHQYDNGVASSNTSENKSKNTTEIATNQQTYIIQKGDTLYSLSKRFNTTVDELKRLNNLSDNNLSLGQKLIIK